VVLKATASAGTINWYAAATEEFFRYRKQFYNSCIICNNSLLGGRTSNSCTTSARVQVTPISTGVVE
jgi:hypothetical protein